MPRSKFIERDKWIRTPHQADEPAPGLWWYRVLATEESRRVLLVYLERWAFKFDREDKGLTDEQRWERVRRSFENLARDGKAPSNFAEKLELWISDLMANQGSQRKPVYWTIEGYPLAKKITKTPHPFMAWFRTLENIAKELYPARVPPGRRNKTLSEEMKQAMRAEYLQTGNAKEISAKYYGTEDDSWRVGQICRKERQIRQAEVDQQRAKLEAEQEARASTGVSSVEDESLF